jgi:hypothetical protein
MVRIPHRSEFSILIRLELSSASRYAFSLWTGRYLDFLDLHKKGLIFSIGRFRFLRLAPVGLSFKQNGDSSRRSVDGHMDSINEIGRSI